MTAGRWIALGVTTAIIALAGVVVALLIWESTRPIPTLEGSSASTAVVVVTPHQPIA